MRIVACEDGERESRGRVAAGVGVANPFPELSPFSRALRSEAKLLVKAPNVNPCGRPLIPPPLPAKPEVPKMACC